MSYREIDFVFENIYLLPSLYQDTPLTLSPSPPLSHTHTHTHTHTHDSMQFLTQNGPLLLLQVYYAASRFATPRLRFPIQPYFSPVAALRTNCVLTAFSIVPTQQ